MGKYCFEFGLVVIWIIWNNRNAVVMNGENIDSLGAANFAFTFFQEYRKAMLKEEDRVTKVHQVWQKPSQGNIKINFDGSVRKAEKKGEIGIIARNEKGEVMGAVQATIDGVTDPEAIEAYAACRGMEFAQQMGFNNIVLEGDALSVILKILQPDPSLSAIGILTEEAKTMKKNFRSCKIQHVSREANGAAHSLVKNAFNLDEDNYWVEDCPDYLIPIIISDCNSVLIE